MNLFDYFLNNHLICLTESEIDEIKLIANEELVREINTLKNIISNIEREKQ